MRRPAIAIFFVLLFTQLCMAQSTPPSGQISSSIYDTGSGNSAGKVGIGTPSPSAVLQVFNPVNANGQVGFQVNQATGGDLDLTAARIQSIDDGNYIRFLHKNTPWGSGDYIDANGVFNVKYSGNVGIGTQNPVAKLEVYGNLKLSDGSGGHIIFPNGSEQSEAWTGTLCGGDYAESVDVSGSKTAYEPGDVLVVDPALADSVSKSSEPYSSAVAGIYSTKPGVIGRRATEPEQLKQEVPMAMVGIVPAKVSAENGSIRRGDLLVTSSKPGYLMKGTDRSRMLGAIVGKAWGTLDSGTGTIEVLVSLQ